MDCLKKHTDTVIVLGAILSSVMWMDGKFNQVDQRFSNLEKDLAVMKAVLIMKWIMPVDLSVCPVEQKGK
jgi:hypothetical protein